MLMKLTTDVNFTNVLQSSFYARRFRKSTKIQLSHQYLFTLSGSESVKAVRRTLMKLTTGVNFTNVLLAGFALTDPKSAKRQW